MTERIEVGLRHVPELDLDAPLPTSDPGLLARLRREIAVGGPLSFARFMAIALYDPEAGYYARATAGPGRTGDFLTAPESHPIFGWTIARRLEQLWIAIGKPPRFVVREHGAGRGALAVAVLDGLRRSRSDLLAAIRYQPIEISRAALASIRAAVDAAGLAAYLEEPDQRPAAGVVIANELLDALPVHLVEGAPRGVLRERFVDLAPDGALTTILAEPSTPALAERLQTEAIALAAGQAAEVCLEVDAWMAAATAPLDRGVVLVIDYGYPADELYAPTRGSTLRAYHHHRVHRDPLVAIGRQDLTAHVDLTAVERAGEAAGLTLLRRTTQAEYLAELGLGELLVGLQAGPDASLEAYLAARSAVARLIDPRATGRFAVIELGRGVASSDRGRPTPAPEDRTR